MNNKGIEIGEFKEIVPLAADEIEEIKMRNLGNKDVEALLDEITLLKEICEMYEGL